ncbi:MAG: 16S rRNA (cytosine(1402)-N(4))-methyltransferase RsmH [Saprospiraceae bacterium]|nr:16S rRNA (cytosine(1402)-N(4))-methyltransferase RsmH [Saprospiraceae bacterium]MBP7641887.1 16S rRNA (cytosine(1402)-N(4))-methyltransferase RsmH [Saprospiraceae bacterium]HMS68868.1 16S rRNA (cytosine(1402)-N(4))-methyltransferase RsmH [Saprospiraceae bacterium]HOY12860.1 16S rRNA (cytosine(1402)-N(4))-methyltransferase RsmH [Saprospiraceae bacterium]HPN70023.1 16S rRNA (cytosine(1402)-N(4))-methyltransferase RsmH [Saprospiraceae bacterium]
MSDYHIPVLLSECIESLNIRPDGIYIDVTFGAGGHSKAILEKLNANGHLYAFDMDDDAWDNAPDAANFTLIQSNYKFIEKFMRLYGVDQVDGILADLGISSHQIDVPERGFSFRFDAPLDMRMNQSNPLDAQVIINEYNEADLVNILSTYGEVRNAKTLARAIVESRRNRGITTTGQLNQILDQNSMGPANKYFAQVYQALRIEVNGEIAGLAQFLTDGAKLLRPGGRFVVMSYHSLEDRLVKNIFKTGNTEGELDKDDFGAIQKTFEVVTKKPIVPDFKEQKRNPRSRSAKLRVAYKI